MNADDAVRDFWANRPRRAVRDRKIAGVAAGIGHRYGIDPTLVRVAFAVLTFYGGAGVLLYLLGWVLLAKETDQVSPFEGMTGRGKSSTSVVLTVFLCLAMIPVSGWVFHGVNGLVALLLGVGALYLLHRNRSNVAGGWTAVPGAVPPGGAGMTTASTASAAGMASPSATATAEAAEGSASGADSPAATATGSSTEATAGSPGASTPGDPAVDPYTRTSPPAWDPLGAAPFAWDLPEPSPPTLPAPSVQRRNRKVTPITLALAVIAGGACILARPFSAWFSVAHSLGIVLAVIGIGLLIGSLVRGGRGLLVPAFPLAIGAMALTMSHASGPIGFGNALGNGFGDESYTPDTAQHVQSSYHAGAGTLKLDLTRLPANGPAVSTSVNVGMGSATIIVPRTADVDVHCAAGLGDVDCLGQHTSGHSGGIDVHSDGPDGPGGQQLQLDIKAGTGSVEVTRG